MKKIKHWFWYNFGKRNWETVWQSKASSYLVNNITGNSTKVTVIVSIEVESKRNWYRCTATDGVRNQEYPINLLVAEFGDEITDILRKHKIPFKLGVSEIKN